MSKHLPNYQNIKHKVCTKCLVEKKIELFGFMKRKQRASTTVNHYLYLHSICRECRRERFKKYLLRKTAA